MTINISVTSRQRSDNRLINFVVVYFIMQSINMYVKLVLNELLLWKLISYVILAFFLALALFEMYRKHKLLGFFILEVLITLCFLFSWLLNITFVNDFQSIVFHCLFVYFPLGWCVYCIDDYGLFLRKLYYASWPISLVLIMLSFQLVTSIYDYYMMLGYSILLPLLIVLDHFLHEKKLYDFLLIIACFATMLIVGSRGPLVCLFVFVIFKLFFWENTSRNKRIVIFVAVVLIGVILLVSYKAILIAVSNILIQNGVTSRTLSFIINGNFTDSGRSELYKFFIQEIGVRPILGWGLAGGWKDAVYPHNIFIEFLLSFGVVFGTILCLLYCIVVYKGATNPNKYVRRIAHVFLAVCISLLFSNSFIMEQSFFIAIALCIRKVKENQIEESAL